MLLQVRDITKTLKRRKILQGISFDIDRGTLTGLVGENGAGKSTLVKIIVGLLKADRGHVVLRGSFGYCPQDSLVLDHLSVLENFQYFSTAYNLYLDKAACQLRMDELMKTFHFAQFKRHLVSDLSGGTRQKLNLCLSLLHDPDVLFLDEPYSGFDWETYLTFWKVSEEMVKRGKTILVVTHFLHDHKKFDRIYTLKEGRLE